MKKILVLGLIVAGIISFGSCKPKQSAYKSVYEAAKANETSEVPTYNSTYTPSTSTAPSYSSTPSYPATNESVRKEKIKPVYDSDASGLKAYSVVIAAVGMKPNAEALKQKMVNKGYNVILAQNEQGMYRVIIVSCDTKEEAVARKNQILSDFTSHSDTETLRQTYNIPFNDWWILQREY